jgi:hypothetical protein
MASFHEVQLVWAVGQPGTARAVGNNAAWRCVCGEVLLGPTLYRIPPCPGCGRCFEVVPRAAPGSDVDYVRQIDCDPDARPPTG